METMNNTNNNIFTTPSQRILVFLANNIDREYSEKEIVEQAGVKKSSANSALRQLSSSGILEKRKIGRNSIYKADGKNNTIRGIKILQNITLISPLVERLKPNSQKVIIFGSRAQGTDTAESDIDIFVQSNNPAAVRKIVDSSELKNRIQLIVKQPKEMLAINDEKPLFFEEINKGKVLWENYGE